ncbi:uncharacterized protein LOC126883809 [Diabrotica virgifera virgifera]|uniref:Ig-like domain-containing protein n=1 Tax=Diabrotica virgifera virgifera TaxID=50390 RepID=A0ABM5K5G2_DIAVI|nr:uncharacterized protein LOC126883809 [Diabrotica virgifera virgifera]
MPTSGFIVLVLVLLVTCEAEPATEFIEASDGGSASLPCNLSPVGAPDKISVVLWYKGAEQNPIYKYDVRGNQPVRWAEPSLQNRYFLRILDDHRAVMSISPTKLIDEQVFHCKVDFMKSSTRITHVNLTIIVVVLLLTCGAEPATEFIEASDGGSASLPCNLSPVGAPDKISVVLWYKGAEQNPIYKYDVRGNQPVRWAEPSLQNRYFLRILDDHRAVMSISPTKLIDEQVFHCKVDFMKSSTRITHVNLTIIVVVLLVTCEAEPATEFIEASDGGSASLPCNLSPVGAPDKISVVLWYKGAEQNPIYKYDVRGNQPVRWAEPSLQNRYFLRILDDHRAVMSISPTKLIDEQVFHCKVDFMKSSTRITHVNLTIIAI